MIDRKTHEAVEASNTDALIRIIDGWCASRSWDQLLDLRPYLSAAGERGKQLWGVDEHIRYRLALEGPDDLAALAVAEGPARFTLGPLTEVVAQGHSWKSLESHLGFGPHRTLVAQERVLRGETVDQGDLDTELPLDLQPFEPPYPLADYSSDRAEFPTPPIERFEWFALPPGGEPADDFDSIEALEHLVTPWINESTGRVDVRAVEGTALSAIGALGIHNAGVVQIPASTALAWMGWAASSGGAHGRRRGASVGRVAAWWAAASMASMDWPPEPEEFAEVLDEFEWLLFTDGDDTGWSLRLAAADPSHGLAWAISAIDTPPV